MTEQEKLAMLQGFTDAMEKDANKMKKVKDVVVGGAKKVKNLMKDEIDKAKAFTRGATNKTSPGRPSKNIANAQNMGKKLYENRGKATAAAGAVAGGAGMATIDDD